MLESIDGPKCINEEVDTNSRDRVDISENNRCTSDPSKDVERLILEEVEEINKEARVVLEILFTKKKKNR